MSASGYDEATLRRLIADHDAMIEQLNGEIDSLKSRSDALRAGGAGTGGAAAQVRALAADRAFAEARRALGDPLFADDGDGDEFDGEGEDDERDDGDDDDGDDGEAGDDDGGAFDDNEGSELDVVTPAARANPNPTPPPATAGRGGAAGDPVDVAWRVVDQQKQRAAAAAAAAAVAASPPPPFNPRLHATATAADAADDDDEDDANGDDDDDEADGGDDDCAENEDDDDDAAAPSGGSAAAAAAGPGVPSSESEFVPYIAWLLVLFGKLRADASITQTQHHTLKLLVLDREPRLFAALQHFLTAHDKHALVQTIMDLLPAGPTTAAATGQRRHAATDTDADADEGDDDAYDN